MNSISIIFTCFVITFSSCRKIDIPDIADADYAQNTIKLIRSKIKFTAPSNFYGKNDTLYSRPHKNGLDIILSGYPSHEEQIKIIESIKSVIPDDHKTINIVFYEREPSQGKILNFITIQHP